MVIIFFLDRAKKAIILERFLQLFAKKACVKSTKEVLEALCRAFLEAQGNITKFLSRVGLHVYFSQDSIDEFDFSIQNLAIDLRDGVRLTKMAETLTKTKAKALLASLRLPTVS